jgi:transcriptional regulator with XRE-family HTH domain
MTPDVRPVSGTRVRITRLRYKLLSIEQPDYQIAAAAHIHPTTLSNYAQGKKDLSPKHLRALCELLSCEPEEIMGSMEVEIA